MTRPPLASLPLPEVVLVEDPRFYDDGQFGVYDRMRTEAPAYYYEPLDVFLLTRMDDVHYVSTHPERFSNASGLTLNPYMQGVWAILLGRLTGRDGATDPHRRVAARRVRELGCLRTH